MIDIEKTILELTELSKKPVSLPISETKEKVELKTRIKELKEQLLFAQYLEKQSEEFKEDLVGYESFKQPGKDVCIKVNFTWGWLRVYRTKNGDIEWY